MAQKLTRKVYKYGTGQVIPDGAVYLNTITQTEILVKDTWEMCFYVWHYFMVTEYVEQDTETDEVTEQIKDIFAESDTVGVTDEKGETKVIGKGGISEISQSLDVELDVAPEQK